MAAFIGGMYVYPTFLEIQAAGETIEQYNVSIEQVNTVNSELNRQLNIIRDIGRADLVTINRFAPQEVDPIQVTRDLVALLTGRGAVGPNVSVSAETAEGGAQVGADTALVVEPFSISIDFTASYQLLKQILVDLETNDYPIDIQEFTVTQSGDEDGDDLQVSISALTYQVNYGPTAGTSGSTAN